MELRKISIFDTFFLLLLKVSKASSAADLYSGDFCQRGIENPVERWEEVVNSNGDYIDD